MYRAGFEMGPMWQVGVGISLPVWIERRQKNQLAEAQRLVQHIAVFWVQRIPQAFLSYRKYFIWVIHQSHMTLIFLVPKNIPTINRFFYIF